MRVDAGKQQHEFVVDDVQFSTTRAAITGAEIRAMARVDPSYGLFFERSGVEEDTAVQNDDVMDLRAIGTKRFYTVPPATFGANNDSATRP